MRKNPEEFDKPLFGPYNTISPILHKRRGEGRMATDPDLHKRGYDLMDSGLN
jgi:hypothetical protein